MYTKDFKELSKDDVSIAGGKGASLGEMTRAGIPVPPGFVVLSAAFDVFMEQTNLLAKITTALNLVNPKEIHTAEDVAEEIQALILSSEIPNLISDEIEKKFETIHTKYVAVRSSATSEDGSTAAWAGQLESYLNTTKTDILYNIRKCWASLFTPRAILYRFEKGFHGQNISVAVVVQKMVESEVSGISFSVHPLTRDKNQLVIEAGFGLGEAIVSGEITPDSYVVEKNSLEIISKNINLKEKAIIRSDDSKNEWRLLSKQDSEKQALGDEDIIELAKLVIKIENHYGFPVDIEWAKEKGKLYILQSRPITTL